MGNTPGAGEAYPRFSVLTKKKKPPSDTWGKAGKGTTEDRWPEAKTIQGQGGMKVNYLNVGNGHHMGPQEDRKSAHPKNWEAVGCDAQHARGGEDHSARAEEPVSPDASSRGD